MLAITVVGLNVLVGVVKGVVTGVVGAESVVGVKVVGLVKAGAVAVLLVEAPPPPVLAGLITGVAGVVILLIAVLIASAICVALELPSTDVGLIAVTGVVLGKVEAAVDAAGKDAMPVGVGFASVCTVGPMG